MPEWTTGASSSMKEISPSKNRNSLETDRDFNLSMAYMTATPQLQKSAHMMSLLKCQ